MHSTNKDSGVNKCVRAAITQCHSLGGLNKRKSFSHSCRGWKSEIKVPAGVVSPEVSLHGHLLTVSPFPSVCTLLVSLPLLIRTSGLLDWGPTLMTSFDLIYFSKGPVS